MTFPYLMFSWLVVIALLGVAVYAGYRLFTIVSAYTKARSVDPTAQLRIRPIFVWLIVLILALMLAARAQVWMPNSDLGTPVNTSTILRDNAVRTDPNNRRLVVPAEPVNTNAQAAAERARLADEQKNTFQDLPEE